MVLYSSLSSTKTRGVLLLGVATNGFSSDFLLCFVNQNVVSVSKHAGTAKLRTTWLAWLVPKLSHGRRVMWGSTLTTTRLQVEAKLADGLVDYRLDHSSFFCALLLNLLQDKSLEYFIFIPLCTVRHRMAFDFALSIWRLDHL